MGVVALSLFIGLWWYGSALFGWTDPSGEISKAIFITFILGIICGFQVRK